MTDFLEQVIAERLAHAAALWTRMPEIRAAAALSLRIDDLHRTLRAHRGTLSVIAEVKRRSPALGVLAPDVDPAAQARRYVAAGARAISVLIEPNHWGGSIEDLEAVRDAVDVPVLAKDVFVDPVQIYEARAAGADAVLLIAEALDDRRLRELVALAERLGMTALVEAHEVVAFGRAAASGARVVGVNARNLRRPAEIDVGRIRQLHTFAHSNQLLVAESGIGSVDDARLLPARVDAVLVGTALMRADDPAPLIQGIASIRRTVSV